MDIQDLAQKLKITTHSVTNYETGRRRLPTHLHDDMARVLGASPDNLLTRPPSIRETIDSNCRAITRGEQKRFPTTFFKDGLEEKTAEALKHVFAEEGITLEDAQRLTRKTLTKYGLGTLLTDRFNGSVAKMINFALHEDPFKGDPARSIDLRKQMAQEKIESLRKYLNSTPTDQLEGCLSQRSIREKLGAGVALHRFQDSPRKVRDALAPHLPDSVLRSEQCRAKQAADQEAKLLILKDQLKNIPPSGYEGCLNKEYLRRFLGPRLFKERFQSSVRNLRDALAPHLPDSSLRSENLMARRVEAQKARLLNLKKQLSRVDPADYDGRLTADYLRKRLGLRFFKERFQSSPMLLIKELAPHLIGPVSCWNDHDSKLQEYALLYLLPHLRRYISDSQHRLESPNSAGAHYESNEYDAIIGRINSVRSNINEKSGMRPIQRNLMKEILLAAEKCCMVMEYLVSTGQDRLSESQVDAFERETKNFFLAIAVRGCIESGKGSEAYSTQRLFASTAERMEGIFRRNLEVAKAYLDYRPAEGRDSVTQSP